MERRRGFTVAIIAGLVVAVVGLGVAFAAFSTVLNINGSATVETSSWDIFFTTASNGTKPSTSTAVPAANISQSGSAVSNSASIVATTFTWNASFTKPGDKIVYTIYVKNGGSYNAKVSGISTPAISCSNDTKSACTHLSYGLYTDSGGQNALSNSFTVNSGSTGVIYLIATLDSTYGGNDGSGLVSTAITTSTISATVTFQQV